MNVRKFGLSDHGPTRIQTWNEFVFSLFGEVMYTASYWARIFLEMLWKMERVCACVYVYLLCWEVNQCIDFCFPSNSSSETSLFFSKLHFPSLCQHVLGLFGQLGRFWNSDLDQSGLSRMFFNPQTLVYVSLSHPCKICHDFKML